MKCPGCSASVGSHAISYFSEGSESYRKGYRIHLYCDECRTTYWLDKRGKVISSLFEG